MLRSAPFSLPVRFRLPAASLVLFHMHRKLPRPPHPPLARLNLHLLQHSRHRKLNNRLSRNSRRLLRLLSFRRHPCRLSSNNNLLTSSSDAVCRFTCNLRRAGSSSSPASIPQSCARSLTQST